MCMFAIIAIFDIFFSSRWGIISASVDDRKPEEKKTIAKSRYDSISTYIGQTQEAKQYSDLNLVINQEAFDTLTSNGIDEQLARHVSHLFIRDPLVIFTNAQEVNDDESTEHFENLQSTNWQTVRFKPPPANSTIGWRVEFRVMEAQFSDFENAAYIIFVVLLTRIILHYKLNFYAPISKVDENMSRAHKRNSVQTQKFYFRTNYTESNQEGQFAEISIDQILNGDKAITGIIPLMHKYLDEQVAVEPATRQQLNKYLSFIGKKASGEVMTNATYMRQFVKQHPCYNKDSVVSQQVAYDLVKHVEDIALNGVKPKELFGDVE